MKHPKSAFPGIARRTSQNLKFHWLLLLLWSAIGIALRFTHLASKSPWTDEFSTLVFSLGNSFRTVPLDSAIALDTLLQPLQPNSALGAKDVVQSLLSETNHPPLYFILVHWWMDLFPSDNGLVSLWVARSFPALLGAAAIPAIFGLGLITFRSRLVGHLAAAMMAVSPYGIFLAQEARHYTLAILWAIASLCCLVVTLKNIQQQKPLPIWIAVTWATVNCLGIATHYFFALTLCAEAIVLIAWVIRKNLLLNSLNLKFFLVAIAGTIAGGAIWLPLIQHGYDSKLTDWIKNSDRIGLEWIAPIFQAIAAWVTMISLLPVEASQLPIVIASGLAMIVFFIWALPILIDGLKMQIKQRRSRIGIQVLGGFVLSAIAIFFIITYCLDIDLTRGARYNFVYFPAVIVLVAASLAVAWRQSVNLNQKEAVKKSSLTSHLRGKEAVALIWLMGLVSAITVAGNLGYQKYYRPDLLVALIQQQSQIPALIATTHKTHVQTGELMGVAWEFKRQADKNLATTPQFLLAHQEYKGATNAAMTLQKTLAKLPRPLNLWLLNFYAPVDLKEQKCLADSQANTSVDGYEYQLYHCLNF